MSDLPTDIDRINALTTNARNTWFALLGVLVFVGMTLMGVEHIDFYGVDRATKLPLVDVEVPTRYFFVAAPILTAAIYGYFHLYLIRLWDALSIADAQYEGRPLGDIITPWLVTDAALQLRRKLRDEHAPCNAHRTMETPAMLLNIALAWVFGLLILAMTWWLSMPARDLLLTGTAALSLLAALTVGLASYVMLTRRMLRRHRGPPNLHRSVGFSGFLVFIAVIILPLSWMRVTGVYDKNPNALAAITPLDLANEEMVERPEGWRSFAIARAEYRAIWCEREKLKNCSNYGLRKAEFAAEWAEVRKNELSVMRRPSWHKSENKPDFRKSNLINTFLVGADLVSAQMRQADINGAQMEGVVLIEAQMQEAKLSGAHMQGANLSKAQLEGAFLMWTKMSGATFSEANLNGAWFTGSQMDDIDFSNTKMEGAILNGVEGHGAYFAGARMAEAKFYDADLERPIFTTAQINRAQFDGAKMIGALFFSTQMFETEFYSADLSFSLLTGNSIEPNTLRGTVFNDSEYHGGALRYVRFQNTEFNSSTDFRNAFLDATTEVPDDFSKQMGAPDLLRPCQWINEELSDVRFYSYWRWWVEKNPESPDWESLAPTDWKDVPLPTQEQLEKHNLTNCKWKTGPMPGAGE